MTQILYVYEWFDSGMREEKGQIIIEDVGDIEWEIDSSHPDYPDLKNILHRFKTGRETIPGPLVSSGERVNENAFEHREKEPSLETYIKGVNIRVSREGEKTLIVREEDVDGMDEKYIKE